MELEEKRWSILGTPFRCLGVPPEDRTGLEALLQGFPPPNPGAETVDFQTGREGEGRFLSSGGHRWDLTGSTVPLSAHLEYRLVDEAIRRAASRWVLHAGAVAGPRGTCLVIGESGAGKTSLTLWLWAHGGRLGTDDLCPIAHGSLIPEAFPRALHMDAEYSPRLMAKIPPRPASFPADYYPFPGSLEPMPPVCDLLVLERGPRPEGEVKTLLQSDAVHALQKAMIKTPAFDYGHALQDMLRLAAGCRAHRIRASTPEGAGERAQEILAAD